MHPEAEVGETVLVNSRQRAIVDERHFDRGSWTALGVVLVVIIASITTTILSLARVGDGCLIDASNIEATVFGACVADWHSPLRPGDELIAVGSTALQRSDVRPQHAPSGWMEDGMVTYTVRRAGQPLDLRVPLHRQGFDEIARAFGYGLRRQALDWNTVAFTGVLIIFALAPRSQAAQLLLVSIGGLTAVTTLVWPGTSVCAQFAAAPLWYASAFLNGVWGWFFVPTILLLVLTFPRDVWPLTRYPRLSVILIYGLPLAATVIGFITGNDTFFLAILGLGALITVTATVTVTAHTLVQVHDPVVRAQTAWLALGLAAGLTFWPLLYAVLSLFPNELGSLERLPSWAGIAMQTCLTLVFPICLGVAITRYRLFDIDVIIRRTLIYGALTMTLLLIYVGSVVVLQRIVEVVTGSAQSDLVTVASTLAIVALFRPLQNGMQAIIDRRFFRRKYDAGKTLDAFNARLRDETQLQALTDDLLAVVQDTLQPAHASLWLREAAGARRIEQKPND